MKRSMFAVPAALALAAAAAVVPGATARTPAPAPEETRTAAPPATCRERSRTSPAGRCARRVPGMRGSGTTGRAGTCASATTARTKLTFTGTITSNDGKPITARAYHLEKKHGDTFSVSADKKMVTFLFNNYGGLDGLDLNMHCSASVTFSLSVAGAAMNPDRIHLGRGRIAAFTNPLTIDRRK